MDALSITASVIAVSGAAARTIVVLRQLLRSLKNAPLLEVSQLLYHIHEINLVLSQIEPLRSVVSTDNVSRTSETENFTRALTAELQSANYFIFEIDELLRPALYRSLSQPAGFIVNKVLWSRNRPKIVDLSKRLRKVKLNLITILTTFALQRDSKAVSDVNTLVTAKISTSDYCSPIQTNFAVEPSNPPFDLPQNHIGTPEPLTQETLTRFLNVLATSDSLAQKPLADQTFSEASTLHEVDSIGSEPNSLDTEVEPQENSCLAYYAAKDQISALLEYLETSAIKHEPKIHAISKSVTLKDNVYTNPYDTFCCSKCHTKDRVVSPQFLKSILGQCSVERSASVPRQNCDLLSCKKNRRVVYIIKHIFPDWFTTKSVQIRCYKRQFSDFAFTLCFRNRSEDSATVFRCAQSGDLEYLKSNPKSIWDENKSGRTALHFAYASRQLETCRYLLEMGADITSCDDLGMTPRQFGIFLLLQRGKMSRTQALALEDWPEVKEDAFTSTELLTFKSSIAEFAMFIESLEDKSSIPSRPQNIEKNLATDIHQATFALREVQHQEMSQPWLFPSRLPYLLFVAVVMAIYFHPPWISILAIPAAIPCQFQCVCERKLENLSEFGRVCQRYILGVWCYVFDHVLYCEKPIRPGATRIAWTCECGTPLKDDFREIDPGALQQLRSFLQADTTSIRRDIPDEQDPEVYPIGHISSNPVSPERHQEISELPSASSSESQDDSSSVEERSETQSSGSAPSVSTSSSNTFVEIEGDFLAVYACFCFGSYGRAVKPILVQRDWTDKTFITSLAEAYYETGITWFTRYCSLWEVRSIRCIKFRLTDHELVDIEAFDDWPKEDQKLDWEYQPFPAPHMPLVSSVYIMHLWQNPRYMSRCEFNKQNTTLRRFLRPFRPRGPSSDTESFVVKQLHSIVSLILSYRSTHTVQDSRPNHRTPEPDIELTRTTNTASATDPESAVIQPFHNRSSWFFNGTPKKINQELTPCFDNDSNPPIGWALYFEEDFSTPPILFWLLTIHIVLCLVFLIATGATIPRNSQDAPLSLPALILSATTFLYAMVSKNCECLKKSLGA